MKRKTKLKIGIITINDLTNLGNRLQNYATFVILKDFGSPFNIVRPTGIEEKDCFRKQWFSRFFDWSFKEIKTIAKIILFPIQHYRSIKRKQNFLEFDSLIRKGETLSTETDWQEINSSYDFFVAGSDQVWNPRFFKTDRGMYINMLGFASPNKKIALSPSISMPKLSLEQQQLFKKYLPDFKVLSCRENLGSSQIKEMTGRDCVTLLDPTLILEKHQWVEVEKRPKFYKKNQKYVLLYFLSGMSPKTVSIVNKIAKDHNLIVIDIYNPKSKYYRCGPSEFIYLIHHSKIVLTDSFHACVFSILFDKPLRVFERGDGKAFMSSRITNLIEKLGLSAGIYITENQNFNYDDLFFARYNKAKLEDEKKIFKSYLNGAFEVNSNE